MRKAIDPENLPGVKLLHRGVATFEKLTTKFLKDAKTLSDFIDRCDECDEVEARDFFTSTETMKAAENWMEFCEELDDLREDLSCDLHDINEDIGECDIDEAKMLTRLAELTTIKGICNMISSVLPKFSFLEESQQLIGYEDMDFVVKTRNTYAEFNCVNAEAKKTLTICLNYLRYRLETSKIFKYDNMAELGKLANKFLDKLENIQIFNIRSNDLNGNDPIKWIEFYFAPTNDSITVHVCTGGRYARPTIGVVFNHRGTLYHYTSEQFHTCYENNEKFIKNWREVAFGIVEDLR